MCAIVGLCAVACAESEGSLWLDVPGPPDAKTEVLAVRQDGATSVFVFNLADDPITIPSKLDPNARIDLHAFVYAESPAELGLALGPLPTAAEPNQPLPEPAGAFGQAIEAGTASGWAAQSAGLLDDVRIPRAGPCRVLEPEPQLELPDLAVPTDAVAIDGARVLIVTGSGEAYIVRASAADGAHVVDPIPIAPPTAAPITALHAASDGTLYAAGEDGLYTATVDTRLTLTEIATSTTGEIVEWMAGGPRLDDYELYTLSRGGELGRYEEGRWRIIHRFASAGVSGDVGGVAWSHAATGVAVWTNPPAVVGFHQDTATPLPVPSMMAAPTSAGHIPGVGTLVGDGDGHVHRLDGTAWVTLNETPLRFFIYDLEPWGDGFWLGASVGTIAQFVPGHGLCDPQSAAAYRILHLAPLGDEHLVLTGTHVRADKTPITVVRLR